MITLLILSIFFVALLSIVYWSIRNGISPTPSPPKAKEAILSLFSEVVDKKGIVYELGAGWGTLAYPIAKKYPNHKIIAIENSPIPFAMCKLRLSFTRLTNLTLQQQDFFTVPFQDANVIVCYLYPGAMLKLKDKFEKELTHHTWVISNTFAIPGKNPVKVVTLKDLYQTKIYLYSYPT